MGTGQDLTEDQEDRVIYVNWIGERITKDQYEADLSKDKVTLINEWAERQEVAK